MRLTMRFWAVGGLLCSLLLSIAVPPCWAAPPRRTLTVHSAEQFVRALGSNRTIRVMPGTYVLTDASGNTSSHVSWSDQYDGKQLDVSKVKNLRIVGVGRTRPRLLARPRYAWVLRFAKSQNVTLENLVIGHTAAGSCRGGVVAFERSNKAQILRSELFGSGTIGVELDRVKGFLMDRSVIRGCTYGILTIKRSAGVKFLRSTFRDNHKFDLIHIYSSRNVRFERCVVTNNRTGLGGGYALFKLDRTSNVILQGGTYAKNTIDTFINRPKRLRVIGAAKLKKTIQRLINRPDPQYNQIYRVARYRKWVVTASQAGIAFIDAGTGQVVHLKKAYISSSLLVVGKHLWVGTYRNVFRFDGLRAKSYAYTPRGRGNHVLRGPRGEVYVRGSAGSFTRYDNKRDRLVAFSSAWSPSFRPYDVVFQPGVVWAVNMMAYVGRWQGGQWFYYRRSGYQYVGRDPRRFYVAPGGRLWVADFRDGFFYYDPGRDAFLRDPVVSDKGSDMAVDRKRKRTWFLHYTRGIYLKRPGKAVLHIDLSRLRYMRAVTLEPRTGDLWVAGWNGLVRLHKKGGVWKQQSYLVR